MRVYVGTPAHGVWKSADGGATFSAMNWGLEAAEIDSLIVDPADNGILYARVNHHGVWRWREPTRRWEPLNDGLPVEVFSGAIAIDARYTGVLYAATESRGVWRLELSSR
jgi:hypothetical protein